MRRLRTLSTRRLYGFFAAVTVLLVGAGIAQASLGGPAKPDPKPLDRAVLDALNAPRIDGVSARVKFTNGLLPGGSLPNGAGGPLAAGAEGRLWIAGDGRFRVELQSDRGDAQIVDDGKHLTLYDPSSKTVYTAPSHAGRVSPTRRDATASRSPSATLRRQPTLAGVDRALGRLGEDWTLSGARPGTTGNRPSYSVRIAPKDDGGLLGAAEVAWDAARGVPLRAAVYAQGTDKPVLELEATGVEFGSLPASALSAHPPREAKVVEIDPPAAGGPGAQPTHVRGAAAVQRRVGFRLAAPAELAGLPRTSVRLVRMNGADGALSTYGKGLGAIVVLQRPVAAGDRDGLGGIRLPQVNIDGATGTELATPLGTVLNFARDGVSYTVAGSVPPVAAENAARGLR